MDAIDMKMLYELSFPTLLEFRTSMFLGIFPHSSTPLARLISGLQSMYRVKVNSFSVLCRNEVRIPWPTMNLPIPILVRYQSGGDMNLKCGFEPLNSKYNISFILLFWPMHFWIRTFSQLWQNMYCDIITESFN